MAEEPIHKNRTISTDENKIKFNKWYLQLNISSSLSDSDPPFFTSKIISMTRSNFSSSYCNIFSLLRPVSFEVDPSRKSASFCSKLGMLDCFKTSGCNISWCALSGGDLTYYSRSIILTCCLRLLKRQRIFRLWRKCSLNLSHHIRFFEWWM